MNISLFLMTSKGYQVLKAIIEVNLIQSIDLVIIGIDKDVINDYSADIKALCEEFDINYFMSNDKFKIDSTYAIAVSWRWIIQLDDTKLIVLHDSILPKYRGFAPLVSSLINKEENIGVTAIFASSDYDKGSIIAQRQISIEFPIKIIEAIDKISVLYTEIIVDLLKKINLGIMLESYNQNEEEASYSLWLDSDDYFINWNDSSSRIERFVDAVGYPYQGAKCFINNEIVVINSVTSIMDLKIENRDVGKVIFIQKDKPVIVCGSGLLRINEAEYEATKISALPLLKFRTKFK